MNLNKLALIPVDGKCLLSAGKSSSNGGGSVFRAVLGYSCDKQTGRRGLQGL